MYILFKQQSFWNNYFYDLKHWLKQKELLLVISGRGVVFTSVLNVSV